MKLRAYAPALVAVAGLFFVYRYVTQKNDDAPKPATQQHVEANATTAPEAPALPAGSSVQPLPTPPPPQLPGVAPKEAPKPMDPAEAKAHEPKAKLPKMNDAEKAAAAQEHISVMDRRIELLEAEIAELDKKGDKAQAAEQRIIVKRLKAHAEKLKKDIAEGREPE